MSIGDRVFVGFYPIVWSFAPLRWAALSSWSVMWPPA